MDPNKKKKLITGLIIGASALTLGILAIIFVPKFFKVNYSETYRQAKALEPKISEIYHNDACDDVADYVLSSYTDNSEYEAYINKCNTIFSGVSGEIDSLGATQGITKNSDLKRLYDQFKSAYASAASNTENLSEKLSYYKAYHQFSLAVDEIYSSSTDAEINSAANYLIESGSEELKAYGEGWRDHALALVRAYRTYDNVSYSDPNYDAYHDDYYAKRSEHSEWVAENRPDIESLYPIEISDTSDMHDKFEKLYDGIVDVYEENYDYASGDCTELLGEVICD